MISAGHPAPTAALAEVVADLRAEGDALDAAVTAAVGHSADAWRLATPAEGWTIGHQVGHLAWTDDWSLLACTDAVAFQRRLSTVTSLSVVDDGAASLARHEDLLDRWRRGRTGMADALLAVPEGTRLPWFGPPMSAASMATARLMETWAHGLDVREALGLEPNPSDRLRHVARLGVRTRGFAYVVNGLEPPTAPVRVTLDAPGGSVWELGDRDAGQSVTGPALDFCLLVTQRRHRDDLALVAVGPDAEQWLGIAQAFAGAPGSGRAPQGR